MTWVSGLVPWLSREHGFVSNWEFFIQSGIGSCIAPNAGIALPPAKGKSRRLRMPIGPTGSGIQGQTSAPDQGVIEGNLGYPTGKQRGRESKHNIPFHYPPPPGGVYNIL